MIQNKYKGHRGEAAELRFKTLMESRGNLVRESTREEDIYQHIDFWVNDVSFDVKGMKNKSSIWLELRNVQGKAGWLKAEVNYVAFDLEDVQSFAIFKTRDLLEFVQDNVTESARFKSDYLRYYTREGKKDVIVQVTFDDIKHLLIKQLSYATT